MLSPVLNSLRNVLTENLELEARFGYYTDRFNSNVRYIYFERLLEYLRENFYEFTEISNVEYLNNNIRKITIYKEDTQKVLFQRKVNIKNFDLYEYNVRISVNKEENLEPIERYNIELTRIRERHSFKISQSVRADLTMVRKFASVETQYLNYEVELECLNFNYLKDFEQQLQQIFKILYGTNIIYTNTIKSKLIIDINLLLNSKRKNSIDKTVLVEARNIKRRDLVYGGIVGNQSISNPNLLVKNRRKNLTGNGTNYMITYKADGLRKMLIIHDTGVWLVYPPYEYNLVLQDQQIINNFNKTIIDGELVKQLKDKQTLYWFLGFDCLFYKGKNIQTELPYTERINFIKIITKSIRNSDITVDIKRTEEIVTPKDFFYLVSDFLKDRYKLEYPTDGLMFIPIDTHYNPKNQNIPLKERVLTRLPDICKWKEGKDITIDFAIGRDQKNNIILYSYSEQENQNVVFRGNERFPLTSDMIDHRNRLTANLPNNIIVEYEWNQNVLRPRKIRYDKSSPNRLSVALDNWEDIMDPITERDIKGETLMFSNFYRDRVKYSLYQFIQNEFKQPTVLDFGGSANEWIALNNGTIISITFDSLKYQRLSDEIVNFGINNVKLIKSDINNLVNDVIASVPENVDVIVLFSMSDFWSNESILNDLVSIIVNTLKEEGYVIFYTLNAETLEQLFKPAFGDSRKIKVFNDLVVYFEKNTKQVNFVNSITKVSYNENLVYLSDLTLKLNDYDIFMYEINRCETEKLLNELNSIFSSLYSFGYYINKNLILKNTKLTKLMSDTTKERISLINASRRKIPKIPTITKLSSESSPKLVISKPTVSNVDVGLSNLQLSESRIGPSDYSDEPIEEIIKKYPEMSGGYSGDYRDLKYLNKKLGSFPLVKIRTIGDGNCFFHSVLYAIYPKYQNNPELRHQLAINLRLDIAKHIDKKNPETGLTYWESASNGHLVTLLIDEFFSRNAQNFKIDYSVNGIKRLLNSNAYVGDEILSLTSNLLDINIIIIEETTKTIRKFAESFRSTRKSILILGNQDRQHYETCGVLNGNYIQTVFDSDDSFKSAFLDSFKFHLIDQTFSSAEILENIAEVFAERIIDDISSDNSILVDVNSKNKLFQANNVKQQIIEIIEGRISSLFTPNDPFSQIFNKIKNSISNKIN